MYYMYYMYHMFVFMWRLDLIPSGFDVLGQLSLKIISKGLFNNYVDKMSWIGGLYTAYFCLHAFIDIQMTSKTSLL